MWKLGMITHDEYNKISIVQVLNRNILVTLFYYFLRSFVKNHVKSTKISYLYMTSENIEECCSLFIVFYFYFLFFQKYQVWRRVVVKYFCKSDKIFEILRNIEGKGQKYYWMKKEIFPSNQQRHFLYINKTNNLFLQDIRSRFFKK